MGVNIGPKQTLLADQGVSQLVSGIDEDYVTIFKPEMGEGKRGSATLSIDNENYSEYWLALLLFFKDLI